MDAAGAAEKKTEPAPVITTTPSKAKQGKASTDISTQAMTIADIRANVKKRCSFLLLFHQNQLD